MASEIEALVVKISGDARALEKALKEAEKGVKTFAQKAGASMKKVGKGMQDVGKSMTKYITAPLVAIGAAGLHAFAAFEDNLTKATAIMEVSTEELVKMKAAAIEVGNTTTISTAAAAEAYFFLASAGLTAAETIEALPIVATLAVAGNFDMATATDLVTDAQSALGLMVGSTSNKMREMTRVSDVLTKANVIANASIAQYATALTSKAGAALKMVNKDIEEGVAVLAVFADQGVKAELAGNSLSRTLLLLSKSAQTNKKDHERLGFSVYDAAGNMRNMADIVLNLETLLTGLGDEEKAAALSALGFASDAQAVIAPLIGSSMALRDKEAALRDVAGLTQEVADKQLKSFSAQMKILWNQVRNAAMEIGEKLAPMITWVAEKIRGSLEWWKKQSDAFKTVVFWTGVFLAALGPTVVILGTIITLIGGLALGLASLAAAYKFESIAKMLSAAAQWVLNAAMAAMPIFAIIIATVLIYKLLAAITGAGDAYDDLNREIERGNKLKEQANEMRQEERDLLDASIQSEEDPAMKITRLADELKRAEKNVEGYKWGVGNANNEAKKLKPTWKSFGQAGKEVWKVQVQMAKDLEENLEDGKERVKELKEAMSAAKEEQAKLNMLTASSGIDSQDQMLIVKEQYENLKDMNKELKLQEATVGMTKGEVELYKAEQNGASEATLDVLRAVELENAVMRESIVEKQAAAKATKAAAAAEGKLKAEVEKTTAKMQESINTWGMTTREAELYKLEMKGATEEELEMARALDMKLTELENEKKALDERKKLMKKGEAVTKALRSEEEKLVDAEEEMAEMLKAGAIDIETYEKGMIKLHEETKKDIKVKFKVSGVEAVIAGTADAAARLEEFRALAASQEKDPPVDFKERGEVIQQQGFQESVSTAMAAGEPSEADKAVATAAGNEKARQEKEAAEAARLAEEKKAAREKELEDLRILVGDNKDVAQIRQMLAGMSEQALHEKFGADFAQMIMESRERDEYGNASNEFLRDNLEQFREARDKAEVLAKMTAPDIDPATGKMSQAPMSMEDAKAQLDEVGLEGMKEKLGMTPPVEAGKQTQAQMAATMTSKELGEMNLDGDEFVNMDEALQEIKESTNKMAENNLVVIEPANIGT